MEEIITAANLEDVEQKNGLQTDISFIEARADSVTITDQNSFEVASELIRQIKTMQKRVKEYWEPLRLNAKAAYDSVLARKNEMMNPLEAAEKTIKGKVSQYTIELEKEKKRQEAEARRLAEEEARRKLEEAVKADSEGDVATAEVAMMEAEIMETASKNISIQMEKPTADGVSLVKDYEIVSIDESQLPLYVDGVKMWKTPWEANIKRLIKMKGGMVNIPGVVFRETYNSRVR